MTLRHFATAILILCTTHLFTQSIRGSVVSATGAPIGFATVLVLNTARGAAADADGRFELSLPPGPYDLQVTAVGYASKVERATVTDGNLELTVRLTPSAASLDEVVITAERRQTRLQRTPVAATLLDAEDLRATRSWSMSDITALAPSLLTTEHGGSTSSLFINIRGVMGLHSQTAVATYVDGVYQFEGFGVPLTFNNVESIEVLRGPQGTLFGRNAYGGVLNITTRQPTNQAEGEVSLSYGNYAQQRYQASYGGPLVKDKLFAGGSLLFDQRRGVYTNTVTGDAFDRPQSIAGSLNLRYLAAEQLVLTFNGRFERNEDEGAYPWVRSDSILFAEPYTVGRDRDNTELRNNHTFSLRADYAADGVDLRSITAYQSYERMFPNLLDVDFSPADLLKARNTFDINTITQEFQVSSAARAGRRFDWTLGTFAFLAPDGTRDNAFISVSDMGETSRENDNRFDNRGLAFYGQGSYQLRPKWEATLGLRYDLERQRLLQELRTIDPAGDITVTQPRREFLANFRAFTPKLTLNYKPTEQTIIYGQYARGFRPGGLNTSAPTAVDVPFAPEYSNNYEIGVKNSLFANRLKLNLTGFLLQQRDQQITVIEEANFLTRNTGSVNNLGAELELEVLPARGLQLLWNASVSDAEYRTLTVVVAGENQDLSGNKALFNPPFMSFLALQYTYEVSKEVSVFGRAEQRYLAAHYLNLDNVIRQDAYALYSGRLGVRYKQIELALWGRNLSDERYRTWATGVFLLGTPRMYGATLSGWF